MLPGMDKIAIKPWTVLAKFRDPASLWKGPNELDLRIVSRDFMSIALECVALECVPEEFFIEP